MKALYTINCNSCRSVYRTARLKNAMKCVRCGAEFGAGLLTLYVGTVSGTDRTVVLEAYTRPVTLGDYLQTRKERKERKRNGKEKEG